MVRSQVENTGCHGMPHGCEWKDKNKECFVRSVNGSPSPVLSALLMSGKSTLTTSNEEVCNLIDNKEQDSAAPKGTKICKSKADKKYLGVKVKMPVKDMLRNIRIAKGMDPKEPQFKDKKGSKGGKKRVRISGDRKTRMTKWQRKSLEELAFIVEVLEEDLRTSTSLQPSKHKTPTILPELENKLWYHPLEYSGESDCYTQKNQCEMTYYSGNSDAQVYSPQEKNNFSPKTDNWGEPLQIMESQKHQCSITEGLNSMTYFWRQIEKQECLLSTLSDHEFVAVDKNGRTLLHRAVEEGKRALVFLIAKKMADLKKLDSKDIEGKTSLHLAAQTNQHLIVADLIFHGANINEKDYYGQTCLHLSAQHGYIRVVEVLKSYMRHGLFVDLEAKDINGLSALQVASVALKSRVGELERCMTLGQARLHFLRKEQMMETLKCLLQMECNVQNLISNELQRH